MKKKLKYIIVAIIVLVIIVLGVIFTINLVNDENKITVNE